NRELVVQAVRRCVAGAERVNVVSGGDARGTIATHPAVQAAIAEFQGEVVAVRPRLPEGGGQGRGSGTSWRKRRSCKATWPPCRRKSPSARWTPPRAAAW